MIAEVTPTPAVCPGSTGRGLHVAIIMDGNGRWARDRNRPRTAGHEAGAEAVRRTVEAAPDLGISTLTLFAFSSDNWRRPAGEVSALMRLFEHYLGRETDRAAREGMRISVIGRRARLQPGLQPPSREAFARLLGDACHAGEAVPDVDLLIRTGGEKRLSDFLLWECAYAELVFLDRRWPDFSAADLAVAVAEFQGRERRFGMVTA
jgi:undecaprenyl diphosphate synthase